MAEYQILYWKGIPAQVRVLEGKKTISREMPARFQADIDRIAMQEGLYGSDNYLDQWEWTEKRQRTGDAKLVLDSILRELETDYDDKFRKPKK